MVNNTDLEKIDNTWKVKGILLFCHIGTMSLRKGEYEFWIQVLFRTDVTSFVVNVRAP